MPRGACRSFGPRALLLGIDAALHARVAAAVGAANATSLRRGADISVIARIRPDIIVAPLFDPWADILDLAGDLAHHGYRGALRALTPQLPNPAVVRAELRAEMPGFDLDLLILTPNQHH